MNNKYECDLLLLQFELAVADVEGAEQEAGPDFLNGALRVVVNLLAFLLEFVERLQVLVFFDDKLVAGQGDEVFEENHIIVEAGEELKVVEYSREELGGDCELFVVKLFLEGVEGLDELETPLVLLGDQFVELLLAGGVEEVGPQLPIVGLLFFVITVAHLRKLVFEAAGLGDQVLHGTGDETVEDFLVDAEDDVLEPDALLAHVAW